MDRIITHLGSDFDRKGNGAKGFGEPHAVVSFGGFGEAWESSRLGPVEFSCGKGSVSIASHHFFLE